ncbi:MAG TPA: extracellular solute-binding protein [Hyphomicrobiaceae bacterium]|jgi:microcin C transport system substrate-binding protein|nr:extracellular solute-binding protein [Hyphomicrobiaceae bacterium]
MSKRLRFFTSVAFCACLSTGAAADGGRHGLSAFGDLKYPADFPHFGWVNPDAPKGGRIATIGTGALTTFDSFNSFILKGDAAQGLELLFDSLMTRATDEPDAVYGLIARSAELAADGKSVTFRLRPEAKFADGSPLTADDVVFTFTTLKEKGHPSYRVLLRDVVEAQAPDPATVRYVFTGTQIRDLPLTVAGLPVLSKAYYGSRDFEQTTLEPPLGSGPYKLGDFKQGTFVSYRRRPDYWAKDLPVTRGRFNFDEVRYEYYRDRTAALESFKAGAYDLREEFTSRDWATGYDVPAVRQGRIVLLTLPDENPSGAQGFFLNTRRAKLADARVRRALDYAFDFEWTNKNIFYGLYKRTESFFENSEMKAAGKPSAAELALLEPFRAQLPAEVFESPYTAPVSDGSGQDRKLLREAARLLSEAGYEVKGGKRVDARGEALSLEFLITDPVSERILLPYVKNLEALGISASVRRIDPAQYERRVKSFDFDVVTTRYVLRLTPGTEMRNFWGSEAAKTEGSFNLAGISQPAVDALIAKAVEAKSREELLTATRALDRVLRAGHYWVPQWYKAAHNIAHWDKFQRPAIKPRYDRGIIDSWWYDADKAAKLKTIN